MYYFEKLDLWEEAIKLIEIIYEKVKQFPKEEKFVLIDQLKRAVTSIALNIAEGSGSNNKKIFKSYLENAKRSLYEVVAILKIAQRLYKIDTENELQQCDRVIQLLQGLLRSLK